MSSVGPQTYRVICLSQCQSPVTHMARSEGNRAVLMSEKVETPQGVRLVPCLTGNSLRHRMVRAPGADWLVQQYGLRERLNLTQLNFLFHGGSLTEGGGREDTRRIADMQRLLPLSRLLGGCLPDQVFSGSLLVSMGVLVCEENRFRLEYYLDCPGQGLLPDRLRPANHFVSDYQYTRGDMRKNRAALLSQGTGEDLDLAALRTELGAIKAAKKPTKAQTERKAEIQGILREWEHLESEESGTNLMIFSGEALVAGTALVHDFILPGASRLELGALLWSLVCWARSGGAIGGQAARGHGRLRTQLVGDVDQSCIEEYLAYADAVRVEAVAWLDAAFRRSPAAVASAEKRARVAARGA